MNRPIPILTGPAAEKFRNEINTAGPSKEQQEFLEECKRLAENTREEEDYTPPTVSYPAGSIVHVALYYKDTIHPKIMEWDYVNDYHLENCLVGYMIICNKEIETPETVVCYVDGKYHSTVVCEKNGKHF